MRIAPCSKRLLLVLAAAILSAAPAQSQKDTREVKFLHVLIVADTLDSRIGQSVRKDAENMEAFLRNHLPEDRCKITVFTGEDVRKQTLLNHYAKLKLSPTDGVLLYYAGHGYIPNSNKNDHYLALHADPLRREELRNSMLGTRAGLVVLLTDCCSGFLSDRSRHTPAPPVIRTPAKPRPASVPPGFHKLLFATRGVVDITAADDGELACGSDNEGGYFTQALRLALTDVRDNGKLTWPAFYSKLKEHTVEVAGKYGNPAQGKLQSSRAFELPGTLWGFVVEEEQGMLKIAEVAHGSPAERAGLRPGERVLKVNKTAVHTKLDCFTAVSKTGNPLTLVVQSAGGAEVPRVLHRKAGGG